MAYAGACEAARAACSVAGLLCVQRVDVSFPAVVGEGQISSAVAGDIDGLLDVRKAGIGGRFDPVRYVRRFVGKAHLAHGGARKRLTRLGEVGDFLDLPVPGAKREATLVA